MVRYKMNILITNEPEKWEIYEREKAIITAESKSSAEYTEKIIALIKKLEL